MLSSATLFHFTSKLETLKMIISGGFKPFYSSEDLKLFGIKECPGIPMVCFCDIPLSRTQNHVDTYGYYALGFDKKWGMNKNISPVHYIYEGSICAQVIKEVYHSLPGDAFYKDCGCMKFNSRTAIFFYGKPYYGHVLKKDKSNTVTDGKEVIFYDEREWRYVPFADQTIKGFQEVPPGIRAMLSEKEYLQSKILDEATNSLHKHYKLSFKAEDVKYIIVRNENEIPEMVDFIYSGFQGYNEDNELVACTNNEKKRLMTRVISIQQIKEDF